MQFDLWELRGISFNICVHDDDNVYKEAWHTIIDVIPTKPTNKKSLQLL